MTRIIRTLLIAGMYLVDLAYLLIFRVCMLFVRYRSLCIGDCRFWGPKEFISVAQRAMVLIEREDPALFRALRTKRCWFWYHPSRLFEVAALGIGLFSVSRRHTRQEAIGVVSRLVWAHFALVGFKRRVSFSSPRYRAEVESLTEHWLAEHLGNF